MFCDCVWICGRKKSVCLFDVTFVVDSGNLLFCKSIKRIRALAIQPRETNCYIK